MLTIATSPPSFVRRLISCGNGGPRPTLAVTFTNLSRPRNALVVIMTIVVGFLATLVPPASAQEQMPEQDYGERQRVLEESYGAAASPRKGGQPTICNGYADLIIADWQGHDVIAGSRIPGDSPLLLTYNARQDKQVWPTPQSVEQENLRLVFEHSYAAYPGDSFDVVLLGGPAAVSEAQLRDIEYLIAYGGNLHSITRLWGEDRVATAIAVSQYSTPYGVGVGCGK